VFGCGSDRDRAEPWASPAPSDYAIALPTTRARWSRRRSSTRSSSARAAPIWPGRTTSDPDRARAINHAIATAQSGDLILIAGKGHEPYQLLAGRRLDFDDRLVARAAIESRLQAATR
jgi:UDP-N-acetylmuramoyl-L-alanyl-D-glutamate--2,6-diaminopimelate ligase